MNENNIFLNQKDNINYSILLIGLIQIIKLFIYLDSIIYSIHRISWT